MISRPSIATCKRPCGLGSDPRPWQTTTVCASKPASATPSLDRGTRLRSAFTAPRGRRGGRGDFGRRTPPRRARRAPSQVLHGAQASVHDGDLPSLLRELVVVQVSAAAATSARSSSWSLADGFVESRSPGTRTLLLAGCGPNGRALGACSGRGGQDFGRLRDTRSRLRTDGAERGILCVGF